MALVTTRPPQTLQPEPASEPTPELATACPIDEYLGDEYSSDEDPNDRWVDATWEEFVAISDDPKSEKASCYYYNHQMRIETMGVGPDHAVDNSILHTAIILYCTLKGIPVRGLVNGSYQKSGCRDAQPDASYHLNENAKSVPTGNSIIDLNLHHAPDLTIEIAATSLKDDLSFKRLLYEELGVQEYWVVDVERTEIFAFQVLEGGGSRRITMSVVLPGLAIATIENALRDRKTSDDSQIMANLMKEFSA